MKKMLLFFSHTLTPKQVEDAKQNWKVGEFVYLPKDLQYLFSNVPPELETLHEYAKPLVEFLRQNIRVGDLALIQGDFGLTCILVKETFANAAVPVYATTKRVAIEKSIGGKSVKVSQFEHIRFRRYDEV